MTDAEIRAAMGRTVAAALRAKETAMPRYGDNQIAAADRALAVALLHADGAETVLKATV